MVQYDTTGQYRISGFRQPGNNEYPDSIQYPDQSNLLHNRTNPEWLQSPRKNNGSGKVSLRLTLLDNAGYPDSDGYPVQP